MPPTRIATFFWPVVDGVLYAAQRNKVPYVGYWGAVGEKHVRTVTPRFSSSTQGPTHASTARVLEEFCVEPVISAGKRGVAEELFVGRNISESDFSGAYEFGYVDDGSWRLMQVIGTVHRDDFFLDRREVSGVAPVYTIPDGSFFPTAQIALYGLRLQLAQAGTLLHARYAGLTSQISGSFLSAANRIGVSTNLFCSDIASRPVLPETNTPRQYDVEE